MNVWIIWVVGKLYYEMSGFYRVSTTLILHCLFIIAADRPRFRLDYKYEKAFNAFYKLHQAASTWPEARVRCQAEGAELLVPDSLDEADSIPLLMTSLLHRFEGIFVGIHDLYAERSFVTIKGGYMLVSILNLLWEYRHPTHRGGRCVAMRRTGKLFVHPCNHSLPFICKVMAYDTKYYPECNSYDPNWKMGFVNDTCYFFHVEPQTWHQAYATCLSAGGHLAIINNQAEADHLKSMFKQTEARRLPDNDFAFIGFNDLFERHHYRTIHGTRLAELQYRDWEQRGCSRKGNISDGVFRCGGVRRTGLLSTWDCNTPAMFFCEKPAYMSMTKNIMRQRAVSKSHRRKTTMASYEQTEVMASEESMK